MAQKHNIDCTEQPMTRYGTIQQPSRRYRRLRHPSFAAAIWTANNPLLQRGELGAETDTNKLKVGDGVTYWNDLPYITSVGQPLSTADYQMGNSSGGWTTMSQAQQDALNSGATATNISEIAGKVNIDGSSTMTGVLKMRASISFECAIAPYWHGVGLYQLNDNDSVTLLASMETPDGWCPGTNDTFNMGSTSKKWKNLYLSGTAYVGAINNGFNITVPVTNSADEFALKSQVDLKANSADLGTAAYTASSDYATAAQGTKADTAVQPGDLATVATTGEFSDLQNKPTTLAGYGITDGANTDLSNLTSKGANIGNWSSNVTNCITEIPQDIKLELSSGTLTLVSGSKLYLPNGVGVFNDYSTTQNYNVTQANNGTYLVFFNGNSIFTRDINKCFSGTEPSPVQTYSAWYDTANNLIKYTANSTTWQTALYLPIAQVTVSGGAISSIDQVFNGFGYIGNTVFVLPGVKALVPYYRNSDGSLKNTVVTSSSVQVYTPTSVVNDHKYTLAFNGTLVPFYNNLVYNEQENRNYAGGNATSWADIGYIYFSDNKLSQFFVKQPFHALDYDDSEYIAHQAMPGTKYIDLTFTHGMTATAPADGYFVLAGYVSSATLSNNGGIVNTTTGVGCTNVPTNISGANSRWTLPVRKGDTVQMYLYGGTATVCRFVFANGVK